MSEFNEIDGSHYWAAVHDRTAGDLPAVCFPDHPLWFNRFHDRIQRYAVGDYLRGQQLSLAGRPTLDVGCGRGRWLQFFATRYGATVTGVEIAPSAVEACRRRGFDVHQTSVGDLSPIGDASIELISSITVLMHVSDDEKRRAAAEFARVLAPGGRVLVIESTWNDPAPHVHGITVEAWQELMGGAGLRLTHASAHCFNLARRHAPAHLPKRDALAIAVDYPLEFALMRAKRGRRSGLAMQHLMAFEHAP